MNFNGLRSLSPPDGLNAVGAGEWVRVIKLSSENGLAGELDRQALYVYCEAFQEFDNLVKRCAQEDYITISEKGLPYQNPVFGMKNKAAERLLKAAKEFGLTPWARSKIDLPDAPNEDEFTAFLKKGKA